MLLSSFARGNGGITCSIMGKLKVQQLSYDLTPVAGLTLVGHLLDALGAQFRRIDAAAPVGGGSGIATSDVVRSYLGLLAQRLRVF